MEIITLTSESPYPNGLPLYWRNEITGNLEDAFLAYLDYKAAPEINLGLTNQQVRHIIRYLQYYINAPCWEGEEIEKLRDRSKTLTTLSDITEFIYLCSDEGLDPL